VRKRTRVEQSSPVLFELPRQTEPPRVKIKRLNHCLWTAHKAQLIQCYLDYFVYITRCGTYIDGFAGPQDPTQLDSWSAKRVLESQVRPKRIRNFFLFDADPAQIQRLEQMRSGLPPLPLNNRRRVEITQGDFNDKVVEFLGHGEIPIEPTFCLLDQRTFECRWSTVEALARYKPKGSKIELFYFLPIAWLDRAFSATSKPESLDSIAAWWGRDDWPSLRNLKKCDRASVFTQRFLDLGYADVKPWPIYNEEGSSRIMYYMIHATDHQEAPVLMRRAYERVGLAPPATGEQQLDLEFVLSPPNPPTPDLPEDLFGPLRHEE
jgi:three-Cys-motif partner protein